MTPHEEVMTATHQFYDALNTLFAGDDGPMRRLWLKDERISSAEPTGGWTIGSGAAGNWDAVSAVFGKSGRIAPTAIKTRVLTPEMAYALVDDQGELIAKGKPVRFTARSTYLFRKVDGIWYLVHHHIDTIRDLRKALAEP